MEANRDQNFKTVVMGISSDDNITPIMFSVDPATNYLLVAATSDSLVPTSLTTDKRDQNFVPTAYGISSTDGTTLIPIRTDTAGRMLVQFT